MKELHDLLGEWANGGELSPRLQELLAADPEARRVYREYLNLHLALKSHAALPVAVAPPARSWRPFAAAAAAAILIATMFVATSAPDCATLTKSAGARWTDGAPSLREGSTLDLAFGYAELTLTSRVRLVLEAPVRLRLDSAMRVRLERGRVVAEVPPEAKGFTVDTPPARVVDLGTEFGVAVLDDGRTDVQVFRGEVETAGRRLEEGEALRFDSATAAPKALEFEADRFTRMFPADVDGGQPAGLQYNRPRHEAVRVRPAPAAVTIDGDLADWEAAAPFAAACRPPFHESHTLEGRLMYDERHLYVAASVGDPAPMRSISTTPAWRGGSVILRLAPPSWPLEGKGPPLADSKHPEIGRRPVDVDDRIAHLTFWYHRPAERPRLHLAYGMDFHGEVEEPQGWSGAFRKRADGLGYVLEYRIPWALLNLKSAPKSGDVLPSTWTVHWSDLDGVLSRGHLVEVCNLAEPPFRFLRGRCWGRALFE